MRTMSATTRDPSVGLTLTQPFAVVVSVYVAVSRSNMRQACCCVVPVPGQAVVEASTQSCATGTRVMALFHRASREPSVVAVTVEPGRPETVR